MANQNLEQFTFTEETGIRISCANFVRIIAEGENFEDGEKRYMLLLNRASLFRGTRDNNNQPELVLTPIGGGTEFTPKGVEEIRRKLEQFGGIDFEHNPDIRVRISNSSLAINILMDLISKDGIEYRERIGNRELSEEMGDETGIFTEQELENLSISPSPIVYEAIVDVLRGNWTGKTRLFAEVYDVDLPYNLF